MAYVTVRIWDSEDIKARTYSLDSSSPGIALDFGDDVSILFSSDVDEALDAITNIQAALDNLKYDIAEAVAS